MPAQAQLGALLLVVGVAWCCLVRGERARKRTVAVRTEAVSRVLAAIDLSEL